MHPYTGNPGIPIVSPPTFSLISDGDDLDEGNLTPAHEQEADYIAALLQGKQETATSVTKWCTEWQYSQDDSANRPQWIRYMDGSGEWTFQGDGTHTAPTNYGRDEGYIEMRLDLPHGASLTRLEVYLQGANHGADANPFSKPKIQLFRRNFGPAPSSTTLIDYQDPSPDFATYQAWHTILAGIAQMPGGTAITIDNSYIYRLVFLPEGWGGAADTFTGTLLGAVKCTFDTSAIDRRAA